MSFLEEIKRRFPDGQYPGDQYGGGRGGDGRGLPTDEARNFMFATGIECSYPTIRNGTLRRDLLAECGHYDNLQKDLDLVRELGLRVLRYGLPYHKVHLGPGQYDWEWCDRAMEEIRKRDIVPILDLLHFGVPDWMGNFQNPELPLHFAAYCDAVAERYPWVRYYTPVNEMYVTARLSARDGVWNEQERSDRAFVTAIKHLVAASILGTQAIVRRHPNAVVIQSESAEYWHELRATPTKEVRIANLSRFMPLDLFYAVQMDGEALVYLLDNGLTREEYDWFMAGEPPGYHIIGSDYYGRNERIIMPDGSQCMAEDVMGWYQLACQFYRRYQKPLMGTETNTFDADTAGIWLWKQWVNVLKMRDDGVPVLGFTWYSLIDQVDWDTQLGEKNDRVQACGLFDLDRNPRPVSRDYRMLLEEFGQINIMPYSEYFAPTDKPAHLKVKL